MSIAMRELGFVLEVILLTILKRTFLMNQRIDTILLLYFILVYILSLYTYTTLYTLYYNY